MKYLDFIKLQSESAATNPWPVVVNEPACREDLMCADNLNKITTRRVHLQARGIAPTSCIFGRQDAIKRNKHLCDFGFVPVHTNQVHMISSPGAILYAGLEDHTPIQKSSLVATSYQASTPAKVLVHLV